MASTSTSEGVQTTDRQRGSAAQALLESLRPRQWVKNGFVFAALIFSRNLTDWRAATTTALAALVFCALASAAYLLNDVLDVEEDRKHPLKRLRPVASGRLAPGIAVVAATL